MQKEGDTLITNVEDGQPIFLQVASMLEEGIISGAYPEGGQVPSITEISVACKINPATALKGVNRLVEGGVLYKKRGLGMFVAAGARQALLAQHRELFYTDYIKPMLKEAKRLELTEQELTQMLRRGTDEHD